jgi:hypothetical protein
MSGALVEAPHAITTLPKPLDSENGCIHTAPVFSIRQSKKRKRHELAVGVDGESVNIYNVLTPRTFSRYKL